MIAAVRNAIFAVRFDNLTAQMATGESVRFGSCKLEFDSKSGQTNDFLKLVFVVPNSAKLHNIMYWF